MIIIYEHAEGKENTGNMKSKMLTPIGRHCQKLYKKISKKDGRQCIFSTRVIISGMFYQKKYKCPHNIHSFKEKYDKIQ